jgi:hypothetical protein
MTHWHITSWVVALILVFDDAEQHFSGVLSVPIRKTDEKLSSGQNNNNVE